MAPKSTKEAAVVAPFFAANDSNSSSSSSCSSPSHSSGGTNCKRAIIVWATNTSSTVDNASTHFLASVVLNPAFS